MHCFRHNQPADSTKLSSSYTGRPGAAPAALISVNLLADFKCRRRGMVVGREGVRNAGGEPPGLS